MRTVGLTFTPLFRSELGRLEQVARLRLEAETSGPLSARVTTADQRTAVTPLSTHAGDHVYDIRVPEITVSGELDVRLLAGERTVAAATVRCHPVRKWTVFVMPTSHIDLYSTGLAHETPEEHARILDAAVGLADDFSDYRYQVENMLPLFEYRALRPAAATSRLVEFIRAGRIAFGAQYTGVHLEEALAEELIQGQLLMMRELEQTYGIRPNCGYTVDVPGTTLQYPQLLARCGVPYWIFSPNRFPTPDGWYNLGASIRRLPRLFRARSLDGSSVLTWLPHDHYGEDQKRFGLDLDTVAAAAGLVTARLQELEAGGYPRDAYLLEHSYGDNLPPARALPALVAAWRERYAYPRLLLATADQFFSHIETVSADLPDMQLEVLDAWAWIVACQGVLNSIARRVSHDLVRAQTLWRIQGGPAYPEGAFRSAFAELAKFAAHDWFYGGGHVAGIPDLAKAGWVQRAREIVTATLAAPLGTEGSSSQRATAFNSCAFARRDVLVVAPEAFVRIAGGPPGQAVDATTAATHFRAQPYSIAHPSPGHERPDAVVLVRDLPALGIGDAVYGSVSPSRRHHDSFLESAHYRVEFDRARGAIARILDKQSGRELVDAEPYGFGQLLLGSPQLDGLGIGFGGSFEQATENMRRSLKSWAPCRLELEYGVCGPLFSSLLLRGAVHDSPVTQAIILYDDLRRIDVVTTIDWDNEPPAARLVAAFPFARHPFTSCYEIPFGVLEVGRDETLTTPRHLRQLQSWLQFRSGEESVVLASPDVGVFSLGRCDLNPVDDGEFTIPERPAAYFILADNGAPSPLVQPGHVAVRFSLTSGRGFRPSDCARFAWGFARPSLVGNAASGGAHVLEVQPDSLLISAVKRAWGGEGLVVRVVEYDGVAVDARLCLPFTPQRAWLADPVERRVAPADVDGRMLRFAVRPHEVLTFLIAGGARWAEGGVP